MKEIKNKLDAIDRNINLLKFKDKKYKIITMVTVIILLIVILAVPIVFAYVIWDKDKGSLSLISSIKDLVSSFVPLGTYLIILTIHIIFWVYQRKITMIEKDCMKLMEEVEDTWAKEGGKDKERYVDKS